MQKIIGVTDLQRRFKTVLDEVVREQTPYILLRGSRPEAVLIGYQEFVKLQALAEQEQRREKVRQEFDAWLARQDQQSGDLSDEELEAEVKAVVEEVRAARWAREQAKAR